MIPDTLDEGQRRKLARIADAVIPPAEGALSASQAGIAGPLLDDVVEHVPERLDVLRRVVDRADDAEPERVLHALRRDDPALYDAFCETVAGAYFLSPEVRAQIGFPGRVAVPARIDAEDILDLLMPVIEGPFGPRRPPR